MSISLSIIMVVKNDRHRFRRALSSVLEQMTDELEVIVIDGGSTDGTLEVIKARAQHLAYWETGQDSGIADAFNRGIQQATGDVVAILNSDDHWMPETLSLVREHALRFPDVSVFYGAVRYEDPVSGYAYVRTPRLASLKYRMWLFHPAIFVRRDAYTRVGLYDTRFTHAMDAEWCHRALSAGERFQEIPAVLASMSLGGVSDRDYRTSLAQYRDSVIRHGLCGRLEGWLYYAFYLGIKQAMRFPALAPLKRLRDSWLNRAR